MKRWARVAVISTAVCTAVSTVVAGAFVLNARAAGPGGWDHLGTGATAGTASLNNDVLALNTDLPGQLLAAGKFTGAGGVAGRDRLASWNGTSWSTVGGTGALSGEVRALATSGGKVYVGGVFQNAGGNTQADFLAVWDGVAWSTVCSGTPLTGNVDALAVIGNTIYVGGEYQDAFGIPAADYLVACDLTTGAASSTTSVLSFSGPVYALAVDSGGKLYAGGNFQNLDGNTASDFVASYSAGSWSSLGFGPLNSGHVTGIVRSLATSGTDLYIGSDGVDIATLPPADHVARWDGSQWHPLGGNTASTNGYVPSTSAVSVDALLVSGSHVYVSGIWQDADGQPNADFIADFNTNGGSWSVPGSDGAGGRPLNSYGKALAIFGGYLHAGGNFTSAGGDPLAKYLARYQPGVISVPPSNLIKLGKVVIKRRTGTAALTVKVPGPGVLEMLGKEIKHPDKSVDEKGKVVMKIRPDRGTKAELRDDGRAKVTVMVRFTPTGGTPSTEKIRVTLVLKD